AGSATAKEIARFDPEALRAVQALKVAHEAAQKELREVESDLATATAELLPDATLESAERIEWRRAALLRIRPSRQQRAAEYAQRYDVELSELRSRLAVAGETIGGVCRDLRRECRDLRAQIAELEDAVGDREMLLMDIQSKLKTYQPTDAPVIEPAKQKRR